VKIVFAQNWTDCHRAFIATALATATLADIEFQTENGAQLFEVQDDAGQIVAAFVLRVDLLACRTVGVVVAAGGNLPGVDLTAAIMPYIERLFIGIDAITVHTARPGLVRKLAPQGFRPVEIILEKQVQKHG
jgi:hypothetical protein